MGQVILAMLPSGTRIAPFGDPVGRTPVLTLPLARLQEEEAAAAGIEVRRVGSPDELSTSIPASDEILVARDDALFTRELLSGFLRAARQRGTAARLALPDGPLTRFLEPIQPSIHDPEFGVWDHGLWWLPPRWDRGDLSGDRLVIDPGDQVVTVPVQRALDPSGTMVFPFTPILFMELAHWVHVLRGNLAALLAATARATKAGGFWGLMKLILKARSFDESAILAAASQVGKGCRIHPTAVVEASHLGDGVTVGAHAVVRFSVLGDGAHVADGAQVVYSVLGSHASVSRQGVVVASVMYPWANSGQPGMQLSVLGEGAMLGGTALLGDAAIQSTVKVLHHGEAVDSGSKFLGGCLGHGAMLVFGAALAPGRALPNRIRVVGQASGVVSKIPEALLEGRLYRVSNGTLVQAGLELPPTDQVPLPESDSAGLRASRASPSSRPGRQGGAGPWNTG